MSFEQISEELDGQFENDDSVGQVMIPESDEDLEPDENDTDVDFVKKGFKRNLRTAEAVTEQIAENINRGDYDNRTIEVFSNLMMTTMNGYNHLAKMGQAEEQIKIKKAQIKQDDTPKLPGGSGEGGYIVKPLTAKEMRAEMRKLKGTGIDAVDAEFQILSDADAEKHPSEIEASEEDE